MNHIELRINSVKSRKFFLEQFCINTISGVLTAALFFREDVLEHKCTVPSPKLHFVMHLLFQTPKACQTQVRWRRWERRSMPLWKPTANRSTLNNLEGTRATYLHDIYWDMIKNIFFEEQLHTSQVFSDFKGCQVVRVVSSTDKRAISLIVHPSWFVFSTFDCVFLCAGLLSCCCGSLPCVPLDWNVWSICSSSSS